MSEQAPAEGTTCKRLKLSEPSVTAVVTVQGSTTADKSAEVSEVSVQKTKQKKASMEQGSPAQPAVGDSAGVTDCHASGVHGVQGARAQPQAGITAPESKADDKQNGGRKKKKQPSVQQMTIMGIHACAKASDFHGAMQLFEAAQTQGMTLQLHLYNTLLYMAVGSERWETLARGSDPLQHALNNIRTATSVAMQGPHALLQPVPSAPLPGGALEPALVAGLAGMAARQPLAPGDGEAVQLAASAALQAAGEQGSAAAADQAPVRRKRGRPRKVPQPLAGLPDAAPSGTGSPASSAASQPSSPMSVQGEATSTGVESTHVNATAAQAAVSASLDSLELSGPDATQPAPPSQAAPQLEHGQPAPATQLPQQTRRQQQFGQGASQLPDAEHDPAVAALLASKAERIAAAERLWRAMKAAGVQPDAGTFLALGRLEALRGDAAAAMQWVHTCLAAGQPVALRNFQPVLLGYCLQRNAAAALEVDAFITAQGQEVLDRTEFEFVRLVEAVAADPRGTWAQMEGVLGRMSRELQELQPGTLQLLQAYFTSPQSQAALAPALARAQAAQAAAAAAAAAAAQPDAGPSEQQEPQPGTAQAQQLPAQQQPLTAGDAAGSSCAGQAEGPQGHWELSTVQVDASGFCAAAQDWLQVVDLVDSEWDAFAAGVASLAQRNEHSAACFQEYMVWYERNGPYDILIDGANVAFFGQNTAQHGCGGFRWTQIQRLWDVVTAAHPDSRVLLMLHRNRLHSPEARVPSVVAFLDRLRHQKAFYYTPPGSNDDWYWMYAAVKARQDGLLVSNDELRDHIFTLLRPKHFLKWKAQHIAHYSFTPDTSMPPQLYYPPSYTSCVQQLSNGTWMFPCSERNEWLCVRPCAAAGPAAGN